MVTLKNCSALPQVSSDIKTIVLNFIGNFVIIHLEIKLYSNNYVFLCIFKGASTLIKRLIEIPTKSSGSNVDLELFLMKPIQFAPGLI